MEDGEVLTNSFHVEFDEATNSFLIYTIHEGDKARWPIRISLSTLMSMERLEAEAFLGSRLLLLVPSARRAIYDA